MNLNEIFPSKFLKAADLRGTEVTVTIDAVSLEQFNPREPAKLVLTLRGKTKLMILNKTNARAIAAVHGEETDAWIGKPIVLYAATVQFQGQNVQALRVRVPAIRPVTITPRTKPPEPAEALGPDTFDPADIPF